MKTNFKSLLTLTTTLGLMSCEADFGPAQMDLITNQAIVLKDSKGNLQNIDAQTHHGQVAFKGSKKTLELNLQDRKFIFKKATVTGDRNDFSITSLPTQSGQHQGGESYGLKIEGTKFCENRDCQRVSRRIDYKSCTYYTDAPVTYCEHLPNGRHHCSTRWERVLRHGWQDVETVRIEVDYRLQIKLLGTLTEDLGMGHSEYTSVSYRSRELTHCH